MRSKASVFLWLCCEGWLRFRPYEWIYKDEDKGAYVDDHGRLIARWDEAEQCWRAAEGRHTGFACHSPMITASPVHPNPRQGGIPNKSDS